MRTLPQTGYTLLEMLFVVSLGATLAAVALPLTSSTVDRLRAASAARYVAGRLATARLEAIRRSTTVALRFDRVDNDYTMTPFVDGNGNGLRAAEIPLGIDRPSGRAERLGERFDGTGFGVLPGVPDMDGNTTSAQGVRIGVSAFLSLAPDGSATSGTLYVHSRRAQYAVRVLGATGRVRVFRYDEGERTWISR
jgi:prepilin-type N-terminal cleavage/methylation domain-containing protein